MLTTKFRHTLNAIKSLFTVTRYYVSKEPLKVNRKQQWGYLPGNYNRKVRLTKSNKNNVTIQEDFNPFPYPDPTLCCFYYLDCKPRYLFEDQGKPRDYSKDKNYIEVTGWERYHSWCTTLLQRIW